MWQGQILFMYYVWKNNWNLWACSSITYISRGTTTINFSKTKCYNPNKDGLFYRDSLLCGSCAFTFLCFLNHHITCPDNKLLISLSASSLSAFNLLSSARAVCTRSLKWRFMNDNLVRCLNLGEFHWSCTLLSLDCFFYAIFFPSN